MEMINKNTMPASLSFSFAKGWPRWLRESSRYEGERMVGVLSEISAINTEHGSLKSDAGYDALRCQNQNQNQILGKCGCVAYLMYFM